MGNSNDLKDTRTRINIQDQSDQTENWQITPIMHSPNIHTGMCVLYVHVRIGMI